MRTERCFECSHESGQIYHAEPENEPENEPKNEPAVLPEYETYYNFEIPEEDENYPFLQNSVEDEEPTTEPPTTVYVPTTTVGTTTRTLDFETTTFLPPPVTCKSNEKLQTVPTCSKTLPVQSTFFGRGRVSSATFSIELPGDTSGFFGVLLEANSPLHEIELSEKFEMSRFDETRILIWPLNNNAEVEKIELAAIS